MTDRPWSTHIIFVLAALALCGAARADQVTLDNGDRVSGRILSVDDKTIVIETAYAGAVRISRDAAKSFSTGDGGPAEPVQAAQKTDDAPAKSAAAGGAQGKSPRGTTRKGRVTLSATYERGNTETDRIYGDGEFTERTAEYRYTLSGKINRREEDGVKTASSTLGQANYDRFITEDSFWYVRGSGERDRFKDIELRTTLGGGYGLQLIDTERTELTVRGGPDIVMVNRFQGKNETYPALGWGIKVEHWIVPKRAEFFHNQDGFWNLDETGELTLRTQTGVRVPLTNSLNASAQVNVDWEKQPAPGSKSTDTTWLLGLGYTW